MFVQLGLPYFPPNKPNRRTSRGHFLALKISFFSYYHPISWGHFKKSQIFIKIHQFNHLHRTCSANNTRKWPVRRPGICRGLESIIRCFWRWRWLNWWILINFWDWSVYVFWSKADDPPNKPTPKNQDQKLGFGLLGGKYGIRNFSACKVFHNFDKTLAFELKEYFAKSIYSLSLLGTKHYFDCGVVW